MISEPIFQRALRVAYVYVGGLTLLPWTPILVDYVGSLASFDFVRVVSEDQTSQLFSSIENSKGYFLLVVDWFDIFFDNVAQILCNGTVNIIKENVKPVDDQKKITLRVFYRGKKLRSLILRNNPHKIEGSKRSHVVYKYRCSRQECQPSNVYVGYTECSLEDRFRNHSQNGSILAHNLDKHQHKITASEMLEKTEILCSYPTKQELVIAEALLIKEITPALNGQREGETRILNIF